VQTLFPYLGGKARQARWISDHINMTAHKAYIEACCGSAAVFFAKKPSKIEILNDLDHRFSLLFRALRDNLDEVVEFCSLIEYSKSAFDESYRHLRGKPDGLPDWKLGAWTLFQVVASFSGYPDGHSFAWRLKGASPARAWVDKVAKLWAYAERLRYAEFFNYNVFDLLAKCDKPGVLLYVDPPYVGAERRYKVAKGFDHQALSDALHGMRQAKVIISHYDSEPYCSFFSDWRVDRKASTQSCKGATVHSPNGSKPVTEAIWFNWS